MRTMPPNMIYLLFLLPAFSLSEVTTFNKCPQFFIDESPPTILQDFYSPKRYEQICQCLLNTTGDPQYFYATLYDTINKIPVYSAYVLHHAKVERENKWKVEPQLDRGNLMCMATESNIPPSNQEKRQAYNSDYVGSTHDKGHLFPVYHTHNRETMLATFTLTNAAPQGVSFNRGSWKSHEMRLVQTLQNCTKAFIVTGVIPRQKSIGNGVKEALYYWNAYCCVDANGSTSSEGYLGPDNNGRVIPYTINHLEAKLEHYYGLDFSVFQNSC